MAGRNGLKKAIYYGHSGKGETSMGSEQYPDVVMPECPAEKILKGQKALVTGGASGIGRAVAIALGKAGADVVVNYVHGEGQAKEVAAEIGKCGSRAFAHRADVSSEEQVQKMFQKMFQEFGTIDILINNAGLQKDAPFDEITIDQWNTVIDVNLTGQFLCAREAVREFKTPRCGEVSVLRGGKNYLHELSA
jgi:glucose 1-dehydrogenase